MLIQIVESDDWRMLFVDQDLLHSGHDIPTSVWLSLIQLIDQPAVIERYWSELDKTGGAVNEFYDLEIAGEQLDPL